MIKIFAAVVIITALVTAFYAGTVFERSQYIDGEWEAQREEDEDDT